MPVLPAAAVPAQNTHPSDVADAVLWYNPQPSALVAPLVVLDIMKSLLADDNGYTQCSMVKFPVPKSKMDDDGVESLSPFALNNAEAVPNFLTIVSVVTELGVHAEPISPGNDVPPANPFMCSHDLTLVSRSVVRLKFPVILRREEGNVIELVIV